MAVASHSSDRGPHGRRALPQPGRRALPQPGLRSAAGAAAAALLAGTVLSAATPFAGAMPTAGPHVSLEARLDGEYGLYVHSSRDSLVVQWLTALPAAGVLEVVPDGATSQRVVTPAAQAHRAAVPLPRGDAVLLRYGANGADLHETRITLIAPRRPPVEVRGVDSLYVVGDTHGEFTALVTGLRRAGLVDDALRWSGGRRHLAFAGDLTDRGPDVLRLLWFVYRLEQEAAAAGGQVHVVLGNHETMVVMGDLRYVHPKEVAVAELHGVPYDRLIDIRETVLGRWLATKPAVMRIDRALIAHGGVAQEFAELGVRGIDRLLARYMADDAFYFRAAPAAGRRDSLAHRAREDFFTHPRSVFWHREYVQTDTAADELRAVLRRVGAEVHVVGHTAVPHIQPRYDGRLIAAHTPRFGAELLLLVRERNRYHRFRIVDDSGPQPF
jgi:hypothetical protein